MFRRIHTPVENSQDSISFGHPDSVVLVITERGLNVSKNFKPQIHAELVQETVNAAHRDLDRVRELVEEEPTLANAVYDRGAGDWETALGGASHMGKRDIVEYLLSKGARMDVFCAATMGKKAILEAFIADYPDVVHARGPHGIPLIAHAKRGGDESIVQLLIDHGAES